MANTDVRVNGEPTGETEQKVVATLDPFDWPEVEIGDGETCLVWGDLTLRFPAVAPDQPPAGTATHLLMYLEAVQEHLRDEVSRLTVPLQAAS